MSGREAVHFGLLVRTFARRFVEAESTQASMAQVQFVIWTIAFLTMPLLRVPMDAWRLYMRAEVRTPALVDLATYPHKLFFLGYAVLGVGLLTLVIWEGIFPDKRDAWVFGSLPVRTRTIVASRLAAMLLLVVIVVCGFNLPLLLVYPWTAGQYYGSFGVARHALAHLVTTTTLAIATFGVVVLLHTLLLNVLPPRWSARAIVVLQVAFVVAVVQSVFSFPMTSELARAVALSNAAAGWDVPLWFLGLYEWIGGSSRPAWADDALRAATLSVSVTLAALTMYACTYRRLCRRALETSDFAGAIRIPRALPSTPRTAVRSFVLLTLARSRRHRLLLAVYMGVGLAIVLPEMIRAATSSYDRLPPVRALAMPLVLIFFAVAGARVLFAIPQEIGANWVFQLTEGRHRDSYLSGTVEATWLGGVAPVVVVTTPILWHAWGASTALTHAAFCLALGGVLTEGALATMRKIPFTCAYLPGSGNIRKWWPAYLFGFTTFTFTLGGIARAALRQPLAIAAFLALTLAAWGVLRWWRHRLAARLHGFVYDEEPADEIVRIDLAHPLTPSGAA